MAKKRDDDYLASAADDFIDCRAFGHHLEDVGDYMNGQHVHLVMQCTRCDSYAILQWDKAAGTTNPRRYKYAPGYLNTTGERFDKNEVRLEKMRRTKFKTGAQFEKLLATIDEERQGYR